MAWETEFTSTVNGHRVQYQTRAMVGYSRAERPDRVLMDGKVIQRGRACDGQGFKLYKELTSIPDE